jgi:DNA-binding beta-propeller fold protein YncE
MPISPETTTSQRPREPRHPSGRQDDDARRVALTRRRQLLVAVVIVGTFALGGAIWLMAGSPTGEESAGHHAAHRRAEATVERMVGAPRTARLSGRAGGRVSMSVTAEVAVKDAPSRLRSVPAGASVRLSFALAHALGGGTPRLVAHRIDRSLGGRSGAGGGHGAHLSAPVPLSSSETFLLNRASGQVVVPGGASGGASGQAHAHEPGQGLAQSVAGGGWSFTTRLPPRAGETAVDPTGRFLAVAYPQAGRIELLDLMRHARAGAIDGVGRPDALHFAPGGRRLWVTDESRGRIVVIDLATRRAVGEIRTGAGRSAVAFAGRDTALVTSERDGRARVVDPRRVAVTGAVAVPRPLHAAYARAAGAFAVAGRDGSITMIGARSRHVRAKRTLTLRDADLRGFAVAPDGHTAVALDAAADELAVVDLRSGRLRGRVEAGADPSSVVFLDQFAIVRNARSADLTWVDLTDPTKSNNLPLGSRPAAAIAVDSDGESVHATLPQEQQVAILHVMMGRPMVMDGIKNTTAADISASVANRLDAIGPKRLEQRTVFERPGRYHLELRLSDGSRAEFQLAVRRIGPGPARVVPERRRIRATTGQRVRVRFRVIGATPGDAQVLALSTSSGAIHQIRAPARPVGSGILEAFITPPAAGSYRLSLLSESQDLAGDGRSGAALRVGTGRARRGG